MTRIKTIMATLGIWLLAVPVFAADSSSTPPPTPAPKPCKLPDPVILSQKSLSFLQAAAFNSSFKKQISEQGFEDLTDAYQKELNAQCKQS